MQRLWTECRLWMNAELYILFYSLLQLDQGHLQLNRFHSTQWCSSLQGHSNCQSARPRLLQFPSLRSFPNPQQESRRSPMAYRQRSSCNRLQVLSMATSGLFSKIRILYWIIKDPAKNKHSYGECSFPPSGRMICFHSNDQTGIPVVYKQEIE